MPERKVVRFIGVPRAIEVTLTAELARLGYAPGEVSPAIVMVLVRDARDESGLLAISEATGPIVAVLASDDPTAARAAALAGARGLLDLPLRRAAVTAQVALAVAATAHHHRIESKAALLERTLKGRRTIEKATQLIASARGIAQDEAYEVLRKAAMSGRVTMAEIAQGYLNAARDDAPV